MKNIRLFCVQSRLQGIIAGFPYSQSVQELRELGLEPLLPVIDNDTHHGAYRVMMFCIGALVRSGNRQHKAALLTVIRQHLANLGHTGSSRIRTEEYVKRENDQQYSPKERYSENEYLPEINLGRYATALHEFSSQNSYEPTYRVITLSKYPPRYQATVTVAGASYESVAKSKRQARQDAAKKACLKMDIKPSGEGFS